MAPAQVSPPATATVTINGKKLTIAYSAPSMRGRKIMGGLVPYGRWWRTGADSATTFQTEADLDIGGLKVPQRHLYDLHAAGREGMAADRQQADRPVRHRVRSDSRIWGA